jgi:hypothetical protein
VAFPSALWVFGGRKSNGAMSDGQQNDLIDLIGRIYDAALDDTGWPELVASAASAFDAVSCSLQLRHGETGRVERLGQTSNYSADVIRDYIAYFHERDEWVNRARSKGMGQVYGSDDLIGEDEFIRTEHYNDFCRRLGIFYLLGSIVPVDTHRFGVIGLHRARDQGPFDDAAKRRLAALLPHLKRAWQVRHRLGAAQLERNAALAGLERLETAMLVVDGRARVLFANASARALLAEGDGLDAPEGRLSARTTAASETLRRLAAEASRTATLRGAHSGGVARLPRRTRPPLGALVAPLRCEDMGFSAPAAVVFLHDPDRAPSIGLAAVRSLFDLTEAEAKLAISLAQGKSLQQIARATHAAHASEARHGAHGHPASSRARGVAVAERGQVR